MWLSGRFWAWNTLFSLSTALLIVLSFSVGRPQTSNIPIQNLPVIDLDRVLSLPAQRLKYLAHDP